MLVHHMTLLPFRLFHRNLGNLREFLAKWFTAHPPVAYVIVPELGLHLISQIVCRRNIRQLMCWIPRHWFACYWAWIASVVFWLALNRMPLNSNNSGRGFSNYSYRTSLTRNLDSVQENDLHQSRSTRFTLVIFVLSGLLVMHNVIGVVCLSEWVREFQIMNH